MGGESISESGSWRLGELGEIKDGLTFTKAAESNFVESLKEVAQHVNGGPRSVERCSVQKSVSESRKLS